jgi:hypothetical protein
MLHTGKIADNILPPLIQKMRTHQGDTEDAVIDEGDPHLHMMIQMTTATILDMTALLIESLTVVEMDKNKTIRKMRYGPGM